jgi:hypothetical protein
MQGGPLAVAKGVDIEIAPHDKDHVRATITSSEQNDASGLIVTEWLANSSNVLRQRLHVSQSAVVTVQQLPCFRARYSRLGNRASQPALMRVKEFAPVWRAQPLLAEGGQNRIGAIRCVCLSDILSAVLRSFWECSLVPNCRYQEHGRNPIVRRKL